ncbi:MAG: MYG1 family protein [Colwellia sp.]|nr:MYG1 family protein [Colwellia sp.]
MNKKTVVTHNGSFHADDVFSVAALKRILSSFELIRTRDFEIISKANIVVDVGGEYDPETDRFDHHQRGGAGERENGIPYSSFGLIWKKYGVEICNGSQIIANAVDTALVSKIDAVDCGYVDGVYNGVSLSQTIGMFNPTWQEDNHFDSCFNEAVDFASRILKRFIASAEGEVNARDIVAKAVEKAHDPRVIVLEKFTPWKKMVHSLSDNALFVIYPSSNRWLIHTVPVELGSFEDRKPLPKQWAGLSETEIQNVTGIDDAMFCHNNLFIAGAASFDSILKMASIALKAS